MRGHGTTTQRAGVRALAAAALPLGLVTTTGLAAALAVRLRALLPVDASTASVDRVVEIGIVVLGLALLTWLVWGLAVATSCAAARTVGVTWRAGERAVARHAPGLVRRVLVVALGAGLGVSGAVTAHATAPVDGLDVGWSATTSTASPSSAATQPDASHPADKRLGADAPSTGATTGPAPTTPAASAAASPAGPQSAEDAEHAAQAGGTGASSDGAAAPGTASTDGPPTTPDTGALRSPGSPVDAATRTAGPRSAPTPGNATGATPAEADAGAGSGAPSSPGAGPTVVVVAGDSLWRIAQRALGPAATDQQVAAEWPRWYAANAGVIGPDPDLVVPGQVLRVPDATPGGTR